jgi:translation initiation factor 2 beta subunit (eIF-2beta)/eIF-5
VGTGVIERQNADETIDLLKILPTVDLIITKNKIAGENTAVIIYKFLKSHQMDIPMIVLGECAELSGKALSLIEPTSWEVLIKHAGQLLGVTEDTIRHKVKPNFIPISINYFFEINHTPCDVYIRVKNNHLEYKFIKRLNEQDSFTHEDIRKYQAQGLRDFYIPKDYQQYFVTFVTNSIVNRLETELSLEDRLTTNSRAIEIVREHLQKVGFSHDISELAESNIKSMIDTIKEAPKFANLIRLLFSSKISYAYQKAHLACVFGNFILSKQSWYEERHLSIFTYLSFFADITLKSNKQMQINSQEELEASDLSLDETNAVLNHAKNASRLLSDFPGTSDYLELVVLQHQGKVDGVGFAVDPDQDIHPIARVFLISDAFVKIMLDPNGPKNKKDILTILYMQFSSPSYHKIIKALEQKIE